MNRRQFLTMTGAGIGFFAGCSTSPNQESTDTMTTSQPTSTDSTTAAEQQTDTQTQTATPASRTEVTDLSGTYTFAFYYPWYSDTRHWNEGYKLTPVLSEYSSRDASLIKQQVSWASNYGLNASI